VFGRHPIPQPGFMGVMSFFESIHLSRLGHDVDLLIPFSTADELTAFLTRHNIEALDDLAKYNGHFSIHPLLIGSQTPRHYDVIINQSYDPEDTVNWFNILRANCTILTKNFPKFVPSSYLVWHETVVSVMKTFDVVACALQDDVADMRSDPEFWAAYGKKVAYVPRGAEPSLLHPARKPGTRPTIGLEIPFLREDQNAIQHYVEPLRRLKSLLPDLRILTLGAYPHPDIESEHIFYGQFDKIYEHFFNEIWLYLIMDYRKSSVHVSAPVQKLHPLDWSARAIYEVQNIEAQMAGSVIIGHPDNIIDELVALGSSCLLYNDYDDAEEITSLLRGAIANFPMMSIESRKWAVSNFTWSNCMKKWATALEFALANKGRF
jgi:glycosyltransferase involved in cell wall biosynthesis